jgi:ribosomal protein S18 acetylase RimI-like enzyme
MPAFVRPMLPPDVDAVVGVHLTAFQGFFLSFLGPAFLRELYAGILEDPSGIALVHDRGTGADGFVAGTDHPAGFYGRVRRRRWWRFGLASVGAVMRKPAVAIRLVRTLAAPQQATTRQGRGLLMSIAVAPPAHGAGIGGQLLDAFLAVARARGLDSVSLTTDRDGNDRVNDFYIQHGFQLERSYVTPEGRHMNEYALDLTSRPVWKAELPVEA